MTTVDHFTSRSTGQDPLPLVFSLRVMAEEASSRRVARAVNRLADRLEGGATWSEAVAGSGRELPDFLHGVLELQGRDGRTDSLVSGFFNIHRRVQQVRRSLLVALLTPVLVFGGIWIILIAALAIISRDFGTLFGDFGLEVSFLTLSVMAIGELVRAYWWVAVVIGLVGLICCLALRFVNLPAPVLRVLQAIPLVGPAFRNLATGEFCLMLASLVEARVPLPESFRLLARTVRDSNLREGAREMARHVEQGESHSYASLLLPHFPEKGKEIFRNVNDERLFSESLKAQGDVYLQMASLNGLVLGLFLRPVLILLTGVMIVVTVLALFLPLIRLLNWLS